MTPAQRAALPLVRYYRAEAKGGGWAVGRLLEITKHGVHVILDHKGTKHKITATDVQNDVSTVAATPLATRRARRIGA